MIEAALIFIAAVVFCAVLGALMMVAFTEF